MENTWASYAAGPATEAGRTAPTSGVPVATAQPRQPLLDYRGRVPELNYVQLASLSNDDRRHYENLLQAQAQHDATVNQAQEHHDASMKEAQKVGKPTALNVFATLFVGSGVWAGSHFLPDFSWTGRNWWGNKAAGQNVAQAQPPSMAQANAVPKFPQVSSFRFRHGPQAQSSSAAPPPPYSTNLMDSIASGLPPQEGQAQPATSTAASTGVYTSPSVVSTVVRR